MVALVSFIGLKSFSRFFFAFSKLSSEKLELIRVFSQLIALFGIGAIPPYAIFIFLIFLLFISKLKDAHTDEISSSILFDILYALKIFFLNIGIIIE